MRIPKGLERFGITSSMLPFSAGENLFLEVEFAPNGSVSLLPWRKANLCGLGLAAQSQDTPRGREWCIFYLETLEKVAVNQN